MPRITKATRTSLPVKAESYDFNRDFRDYSTGNSYDKSENLVVWADYCDPEETSPIPGFDIVGKNQSKRTSSSGFKLYSPSGTGLQRNRRTAPYNSDFCGNKCLFSLGSSKKTATAGHGYDSGLFFIIPDHNDLSFASGGVDGAFSISFWVRSITKVGSVNIPFSLNHGGKDPSSKPLPTFFHKKDEYRLAIDESGRLRLTLYDSANSATIYNESIANVFTDNEWNNIVVAYKGGGVSSGINFYKNGQNVTDTGRTGGTGSYVSMVNSSNSFYFGKTDPSASLKNSNMPSVFFAGSIPGIGSFSLETVRIAELGIWNTFINETNALAIYNASLTCMISDLTTESGYTSLTPRVRLRELDSLTGSYPSVSRTGDRDFRGNFKINFNDLNTINFGTKISDEFSSIKPREAFSKDINKNQWVFTKGLEIRRESLSGLNGSTFSDGVLVFKGHGERFIQTKRRVRNAIIEYELVRGPHNLVTNQLGQGLKLEAPSLNEVLKLQFSITGAAGTWTTLKTHNTTIDVVSFYGIMGSEPIDYDPVNGVTRNNLRKKVRVHYFDIPAGNNSYYIRLVQETTDRANKSVWGIGRIEITSMNDDVRYPLLVNHDHDAGKNAAFYALATPHTRSDLVAKGRSLPGVSDHFLRFTPGENLSPFKEQLARENLDPTNIFHKIGSDTATGVQNMSYRLADKTKITIDLNVDLSNDAKKQVTIGHTGNSNKTNPLEHEPNSLTTFVNLTNPFTGKIIGQQYTYINDLMCFYNNKDKGWVKRGLPPTMSSLHTVENFVEQWAHLGFSPTDIIASRSNGATLAATEIVEQYGPDVLSNYVRPVKTFGFPFSKKYEFPSDETVIMSDYIDKPFVLEKIIVDFDANFEFAPNNSKGEHSYGLHQSFFDTDASPVEPSSRRSTGQHRVIIPSFFILNQFRDGYDLNYDLKAELAGNESYKLNYASDEKSRELVSYGQMTLFMSSSHSNQLDIEKAIDEGLGRDLIVNVLERTGQTGNITSLNVQPVSSSFTLEFPCRTGPKTGFNQRVLILSKSVADPAVGELTSFLMSDQSGGRNYESMNRGSRGLINNYPALKPGRSYKTFSTSMRRDPVSLSSVSSDSIDQYSPYILFPSDELIFGWQYPVNLSYAQFTNGSGDTGMKNLMTIVGNSKVHFYGSFLSDKKEFHEYNNQPLTSDAVHEVIGSEKPLDEYQIATRGELSGSYVDQWPYMIEEWDHPSSQDFFVYSDAPLDRLRRIGSPVFSISGLDINKKDMNHETAFYSALSAGPRAAATHATQLLQQALGEKNQIQRFVRLDNHKSYFIDSTARPGTFAKDSTYGTFQSQYTLGPLLGSYKSTEPTRIVDYSQKTIFKPIGQKYYFNYRNFGQSFDFFEQGKDTKTWKFVGATQGANSNPTVGQTVDSYNLSDTNTPPVTVIFVTSSTVDDSRLKIFKRSSFAGIYGGISDPNLKPFNTSIFCTSSKPYADNRN